MKGIETMTNVAELIKKNGGPMAVAEMTGASRSGVYLWRKENRLPPYAAELLGVDPQGLSSHVVTRPYGKRSRKNRMKSRPVSKLFARIAARFKAWGL